jgi:hypothetical protein
MASQYSARSQDILHYLTNSLKIMSVAPRLCEFVERKRVVCSFAQRA